ncbi:MAG: hypothetical protein R3B57_01945 [Phycisphaerales bacterium]
MTTREREILGRAAALTLLAGALTASGCGGESESEAAVRDAAIVMTSGGPDGGKQSMGEYRESRYQRAATDLSEYVGDDGYESAAAVLAGQAHQGLAAEAFEDLVKSLSEAQHRLTVVRGTARAWGTHRALAEAASTFDPQPRVKALDDLATTLSADLEQAKKVAKLVNDQIAEFESRIAEADANASKERDLAGQMQLDSNQKSATEAAQMAESIREHTRRADRYEFEAQRVKIRADQLRPDAVEKAARIEQIEEQLALVEEARRGVVDQTQASKRYEADALKSAGESRTRIIEQLDALESFIGGDLEDARAKTERELRQATSTASKAGQITQDSSSLVRASVSQRLGEMFESIANLHASVAGELEYMIERGLDEDGAMARLAAGHREKEAEAREGAKSAYADAATALRRVRVRGETKDKLNELADTLEGVKAEPTPEDFGAESDDGAAQPGDDMGDDMGGETGDDTSGETPDDAPPEDVPG